MLLTLKSRKYTTEKKDQNPIMQYIDAEVKSNPILVFMKGIIILLLIQNIY